MGSYVISVSVGTGCYRHIQISKSATLYKLHKAIISAFDFEDDHAHVFFMDNHYWSGYDAFFSQQKDLNFNCKEMKYALMPVWMLSTKWNKQNFLFAMNGQTGKFIGDLPIDKRKYWTWFMGIALPLMAVILGLWFM